MTCVIIIYTGAFRTFDDLLFCMHNGEIIDSIVLFVLLYFTKVRLVSLIDYDSADFQAIFSFSYNFSLSTFLCSGSYFGWWSSNGFKVLLKNAYNAI